MDQSQFGSGQGKNPIDTLSKEELISKYKGLLGIAKKAKQAKDEFAEENRALKEALSRSETQKEADKNALLTMKEMLEEFTQNKLQLATQLNELQHKSKTDDENLERLRIENESLKRQMDRLNEDNESLLSDIDRMEQQLKQVNLLGMEQKKDLALLELEVNKLKEAENLNSSLKAQIASTSAENNELKEHVSATKKSLDELQEKYNNVKDINSEQRKKFNALKDRFVDVYRKLKQLKECKRILLETQYEYSEAVSHWQKEIIEASRRLCTQMNNLKCENIILANQLQQAQQTPPSDENSKVVNLAEHYLERFKDLQLLVDKVFEEQQQQLALMREVKSENAVLKEQLTTLRLNKETAEELDKKKQMPLVENSKVSNLAELYLKRFEDLQILVDKVFEEQQQQTALLAEVKSENTLLKEQLTTPRLTKATEMEKEVQEKAPNAENQLIQELQTLNKNLLAELSALKLGSVNIAELRNCLENVQTENKQLLEELNSRSASSEDQHHILRNHVESLQKDNKDLLNRIQKVAAIEAENAQLRQDAAELNYLLDENKQLRDEILQTRNVLKSIENDKVEQLNQAAFEVKATDNQQDELEELKAKLFMYSQNIEELEARYERKEREHTDLLAEMRELNEALKARGDLISRQQAAQLEVANDMKQTTGKLQQIEQQLNEKSLAIDAKDKQVHEVSEEIDRARRRILELQQICSSNEEKVLLLTEELQHLRQSDTQSEILSTTTEDTSMRLREVDDSFEEKYNKLRSLAVKLKRKLQEQTVAIAEMEAQRGQSEALKTDFESLKAKHETLQMEHEQHRKQLDAQKQEIQKLKSSRKQANVLNLEIEAAEKSLSEVTTKLALKITEVDTLNESLQSKEHTIEQLRKEIVLLEAAKSAECIHSKELKEQVDRLQAQIKDAVYSKQQALETGKLLEQTRESLKLELEEVRLQLANIASKHAAELGAAMAKTQQVEQQYLALQAEHTTIQASLKTTERALADLRVEFLDYKVKAQAVLRKNQNKDSVKEREQEEELLTLRAAEKQLQTNAQMYKQKLSENEKQMEALQEDNTSLQARSQELMNLVNELRQQNENMAQEQRQQMQQQQTALKQQRLQIEQLDACHKDQLQQLETSYLRQIEDLKTEQVKTKRQPTMVGAVGGALTNNSIISANEQSKIDFLLMEREDAEGSEEAAEALAHVAANRKISTASSSTRRSQHDFMPLDELLSSPMNIISDTVTTITSTSLRRADDGKIADVESKHLELQATKERLQKLESHVRHLTALLAENEQDLAKLTQLNDVLKEELRRQERAVEREQHMHNSEYLKNVIVKFLTLNNGDERTRLVPVLNTILRLSRSEAEMLASVAKGQKVTTDVSTRSWGNFLPSWGNNNNNN